MTHWLSREVPYYIDPVALGACVYTNFYDTVPKKSGNMASGVDWSVEGNNLYFWDDVIYAHYQDTVTKYAGWWNDRLPAVFDYWLSIFEEEAKGHTVFDNKEEG